MSSGYKQICFTATTFQVFWGSSINFVIFLVLVFFVVFNACLSVRSLVSYSC
jgi:hypothetical protein